ncbi:tRNA (uracil(54)-C5)-methyltransferase [hydrothermal vent metagenome]|uniref:tRNA (Uracil(54)-C5)-methyltransferase n=1 Tax=hydrothermal vent metagenome TaxID=652676 RepID=A0A1W1EHD5_9ZZZZ
MECKHFGECGSCSLFAIDYNTQIKSKVKRVTNLLEPFIYDDLEVFFGKNHHYRARSEFRIWHTGDRCDYGMGNIAKNGTIIIDECPKVVNAIASRMPLILEEINSSLILSKKLFSIEFLATTTDEVLITMIYHKKLGDDWIEVAKPLEEKLNIKLIGRSRKQKINISDDFVIEKLTINNILYKYAQYESGFTQPNPEVNVKMIEWALTQTKLIDGGDLLESYCGLGNFTIPLSTEFDRVLATEISKKSIASAKINCELNNILNIEFIRLSSSEMSEALSKKREFRRLAHIDINSYNFSTVLVDPPRMGLDSDTIALISDIKYIIYISCNPETLARDLEELSKTHKVVNQAIFDQFPYTEHIESGVFLEMKNAKSS